MDARGTLPVQAQPSLMSLLALLRHSKIGDERLLSEEERSCSRHHHHDRVWPWPVIGPSGPVHRSTSFQNNSGLPHGPPRRPGGRL